MFVNGHFCWALKFAVITNALGIPSALVPLFDSDSPSADPQKAKAISDFFCFIPFARNSILLHSQKFLHFHL